MTTPGRRRPTKQLHLWMITTDLDGFNVHSHVTPESYRDFVELIVPELQHRGLFRDRYDPAETTLRERLFGAGHVRLPDRHPAVAHRGAFAHRRQGFRADGADQRSTA